MGTSGSCSVQLLVSFFFFQAEDGIRDLTVTGVQTCALPICLLGRRMVDAIDWTRKHPELHARPVALFGASTGAAAALVAAAERPQATHAEIGRASCRERV